MSLADQMVSDPSDSNPLFLADDESQETGLIWDAENGVNEDFDRRMADTSLDAFEGKKSDGSLTGDRKKVKDMVEEHGPVTCKRVAELMDKTPNQISGRFTELLDQDEIKIVGRSDGHRLYEVKDK